MLQIFADPSALRGDLLTITGPDVNHIRNVLRMKPGEELNARIGGDGREYRFGIEEISEQEVLCRLRFVKESDVELPVRIILFQGLPKADKMEWIVQKSVELGAAGIVPVEMSRCVVRLDASKKDKKAARWQTIAESAAEQSRRAVIPKVERPVSLKEALALAGQQTDLILVPYELQETDESTKEALAKLRPGMSAAVFIGPEGGFEPEEIEQIRAAGGIPISLGRRILRTETASLAFLSWMIYRFEME